MCVETNGLHYEFLLYMYLTNYFFSAKNKTVEIMPNKSWKPRWQQPAKSNLARSGVAENGSGCLTTAGHYLSVVHVFIFIDLV